MKNLIAFLTFALIANFAIGQGASKTFVKTLNTAQSENIVLKFDNPVQVKEWDEERIRIQMEVKLLNSTEQILNQLMIAGRYNPSTEEVNGDYVVDIPGLKKDVTVRGQKLEEEIVAVLYVPKYTIVKTLTEAGTSVVEIERGISKEMADRGLTAKFSPFFAGIDFDCMIVAEGDATAEDASEETIRETLSEKEAEMKALEAEIKALKARLEE